MTDTIYTVLEIAVLRKLIDSAAGNGDDFGITEDARDVVKTRRQLSGVIASLVKKGTIIVHGTENGWTQFTWPETETGEKIIPKI